MSTAQAGIFNAPVAVVIPSITVTGEISGVLTGSISIEIPSQTILSSAAIVIEELVAAMSSQLTSAMPQGTK